MVASLRALLNGIIDYAGLFPPAALPLDQAIRNYARYRQERESWMLANFICAVPHLNDLGARLGSDPISATPLPLAVVGKARQESDWTLGILEELAAMSHLSRRSPGAGRVEITMYEGKLAPEILDPTQPAHNLLHDLNGPFSLLAPVATHYYEAPLVGDWRSTIPRVLSALALDRYTDPPGEDGLLNTGGFKLRCGGLNAAAFPSCEQVAFVIAACRDARAPLKFTAGLHHPIRHYNAGVQTHMHGFLNVFVAGVLAHARGLSEEQLRPIIEDEDARSFAFDDAGLRWKDLPATTDEITAARRMVTSFGSCSFDEPRDDLRALGWLP